MSTTTLSQRGLALSYSHINLRFNPFGDLAPGDRAKLAIIDFDLRRYVERLHGPGFAVQFLGPSGRGKTTHLFTLRAHFPHEPYTYIPEGGPVPTIPDTPVQFIDELQRIRRSSRLAILRRKASFVTGSHKDHSREFEKAGLEYRVIRLNGLSLDRLMAIINRRIQWARRDPDQTVPHLTEVAVSNLKSTYGDDLWAIENHLYDVFRELAQVGEVSIRPPTAGMKIKKNLNASLSLLDGVI